MDVLTAGHAGAPAGEATAADRGGMRPGKQLRYTVRALGIRAAYFLALRTAPTAGQAGAPAGEAVARDRDGMKPGEGDQVRSTVVALGFAAASFGVAWWLHGNTPSAYHVGSQWGALAGLFILALAIERALEPFSPRLGPDTAMRKDKRDEALASARPGEMENITMEYKSAVDMCRRLTSVVTWGAATGLAFLVCALLNITLMQAVSASGSGAPPFGADLLVTGLVVGAGTKPLHDLVSSIEGSKE
jgi:hypothetical protein